LAGFSDNQPVSAGQLLVRIDPRDYQGALSHAEAVVAARAATLASLWAQYVLQQSTMGSAAENATGNFTKIVQRVPVRIALDAAGASLGTLRPGLSTAASVGTRVDANVAP
jgi:multidrug resistance efflux pump